MRSEHLTRPKHSLRQERSTQPRHPKQLEDSMQPEQPTKLQRWTLGRWKQLEQSAQLKQSQPKV